jgi:hypothetical protein
MVDHLDASATYFRPIVRPDRLAPIAPSHARCAFEISAVNDTTFSARPRGGTVDTADLKAVVPKRAACSQRVEITIQFRGLAVAASSLLLQQIMKHFQWLQTAAGSSMQHARDIRRP